VLHPVTWQGMLVCECQIAAAKEVVCMVHRYFALRGAPPSAHLQAHSALKV
jgi:hypothetical protein